MGNDVKNNQSSFAERHPRWNLLIGLFLLLLFIVAGILLLYLTFKYIGLGLSNLMLWLTSLASKMEAVVIVALITGGVSITGVIISSIVAKSVDYRKARRTYLAQKREKPYGEFVEMVYKIQQNAKKPNSYTEKEMLTDLSKFSKEITLWGSSKVVYKWVKFRENGAKPEAGKENIFIMEDIMNEMRKDMGLKKVKKGNLLAFFVNDIKVAMKEMKK